MPNFVVYSLVLALEITVDDGKADTEDATGVEVVHSVASRLDVVC